MPEHRETPLRELKFTRHKRHRRADSLVGELKPQPFKLTQPYLSQPAGPNQPPIHGHSTAYKPQYGLNIGGATPYERLAADKPGAELESEGTIWQIYVDEAQEHDTELVERENDNLDMMLLFAALFSAILTSFIIESKDMLQEDTAETTVTLLLAIARSQQRLEQGTPQVFPLIERPAFSAPIEARWINGLWFTALALSLAAALIAMLAKEWLATFKGSRPRPAYAHTLVHQERLNGLQKWGALHTIDVLPTLLHLSLLLFSLGLAVYLWTLDKGVAIAEVIVTGATLIFYAGTALLGATYPSCPFVTQISKYIRAFFQLINRYTRLAAAIDNVLKTNIDEEAKENQKLKALWWLTENSRDPMAGDCACQVLAGVNLNRAEKISVDQINCTPQAAPSNTGNSQAEATENTAQLTVQKDKLLANPARHRLIENLYKAVLTRISEGRLRLPQEPAEYRGMNLAQYVYALPKLVYILEQHATTGQTVESDKLLKTQLAPGSVSESAFSALDLIWTSAYPNLSPDSYATFSSAELRLIETATLIQSLAHGPAIPIPQQEPGPEIPEIQHTALPADVTTIEMETDDAASLTEPKALFELKARYSRVLSFVGFLLNFHGVYGMQITAQPLVHLLESIESAFRRPEINPQNHLSTCLPQSNGSDLLPGFTITVTPRVAYESHIVPPLAIGDEDGLMAGLLHAVSATDIQDTPAVEVAAERALAVAGPVLLKQWASMMNVNPAHELWRFCPDADCIDSALKYWPPARKDQLEGVTQSTLRQMLIIATVSVGLASCPQMAQLPDIAIKSLYHRADTLSGRAALIDITKTDGFGELISRLADNIHANQHNLKPETIQLFTRLLVLEHKDSTVLRNRCITPPSLPYVLRLLAALPDAQTPVLLILTEVQQHIGWEVDYFWTSNYRSSFMHHADGFEALSLVIPYLDAGSSQDAVNCTINVIQSLAQYAEKSWRSDAAFQPSAIPPLLEAVRLVLSATVSGQKSSHDLIAFTRDVMEILRPFQEQDSDVFEEHSFNLIYMYQIIESVTSWRDDLADLLFELGRWVDHDTKLYAGLEAFLNQEQQLEETAGPDLIDSGPPK